MIEEPILAKHPNVMALQCGSKSDGNAIPGDSFNGYLQVKEIGDLDITAPGT